MPLSYANLNEFNVIKKIGGSAKLKHHLENLGFVLGGSVCVVSKTSGNLIVNVKDTRIAISEQLAKKIMI